MGVPPDKICASCGRTITWRKKWAADWDSVRYCSKACRRAKVSDVDLRLEQGLLTLLGRLPGGATTTSDEAARLVGGDDWAALVQPARAAARRLSAAGEVEIVQGGRVVDPSRVRGPMHLRRAGRR